MFEIIPFSQGHLSGVVDEILPIQQVSFDIQIELKNQSDLPDNLNFYQKGSGNFWIALYTSKVFGTNSLRDIGQGKGALHKIFVKKV